MAVILPLPDVRRLPPPAAEPRVRKGLEEGGSSRLGGRDLEMSLRDIFTLFKPPVFKKKREEIEN